jgi:hypothetical protein
VFAKCKTKKHSANNLFAECFFYTLSSGFFSPSVFFLHSANSFFAECPKNCTRQRSWHSANKGFPVVIEQGNLGNLSWRYRKSYTSRRLELNSFFHHFLYICSFSLFIPMFWPLYKKVRKFIHIYSLPTLCSFNPNQNHIITFLVSFTSYCYLCICHIKDISLIVPPWEN